MNTSSLNNGFSVSRKKASYVDHPHIIKCIRGLFERLKAGNIKEVILGITGEALEIKFFQSVDGESPIETLQISPELFEPLSRSLRSRSYYWPDLGDAIWNTNTHRIKRIAIDSDDSGHVLVDFIANPSIDGSTQVMKLRVHDGRSVTSQATSGLSKKNIVFFENGCSAKYGLILASSDSEDHIVGASAKILACRPDILLHTNVNSFKLASSALKDSEKHLVVVTLDSNDPVEMVYHFADLLGDSRDMIEQYFSVVRMSYVHRRAKRVCSSCARSSAVDPVVFDRLPACLRLNNSKTYYFGRGCDDCGQAAYLGTVGIDSLLYVDDRIRKLLMDDKCETEVTEIAYRKGTRSLMEDGLEKVSHGLTSFEAMFSVVQNISRAFEASIVSHSNHSEQAPIDLEINSALNEMSDEFFTSGAPVTPDSVGLESSVVRHDPGMKRVLLVEDDDDQLAILNLVFSREDYVLLEARHGKEALNVLASEPVDIIVCDLMMPIMNGEEFLKHLRASPSCSHIPVLMLTAVGGSEAEYALLQAGADDFCSKNVHRKVLIKRVERLLNRNENQLGHMLS